MPRSSISRETRLLLTIALVATSTLWVLARLRFPGRASTPNPVTPVLAQLSPPSAFEDMAASLNQLRGRLAPTLLRVVLRGAGGQIVGTSTALRFRDHLAVVLLPDAALQVTLESIAFAEVGRDRASGLAVLRIPEAEFNPIPVSVLRRPEAARVIIAAVVSGDTATLRPLLLDALSPVDDPIWGGAVWALPDHLRLEPGTFLFSMDGALVGVSSRSGQSDAVIPVGIMASLVDRLVADPTRGVGRIRIEVEPLTAALSQATGVPEGLVVTWVEPGGPAADLVKPADVIVSLDGSRNLSLGGWTARMERLTAGQSVTMGLRRGEQDIEVRVTASDGSTGSPRQERALGLTMRVVPRVGVQVTGVAAQSAAARAGLEIGDIVTRFGIVEQPSIRQITRAYESTDRPLVAAVTRGERHLILAVEKWR